MIITLKNGKTYDSEIDLKSPERHILQKLFLWESMASSIIEFNEKKNEALSKGWNNSGPVSESPALKDIIKDLESRVRIRIEEKRE
jgi:hypothetical protein